MKSEFQFIQHIKDRFSLSKVGDDCAVLPKDEVSDLLITADLLVEDVDFRLDWSRPSDIGHKSLAVSLSDIAAMGGTPVSALISLGVPKHLWSDEFLNEFYTGWHSLAEKFAVELVGGDISYSPDKLVIDSIVVGEVPKGKAARRSGASVFDGIFVSGTLGGAAAGLQILEGGLVQQDTERLIQKQVRPMPQVELGKRLTELGIITSMIDISDGLTSDLKHICTASGVGALIESKLLPIDRTINSDLFNSEALLELALHGGEDYELLMTVANDGLDLVSDLPITRIGTITNSGELELELEGSVTSLSPRGYQHFSESRNT